MAMTTKASAATPPESSSTPATASTDHPVLPQLTGKRVPIRHKKPQGTELQGYVAGKDDVLQSLDGRTLHVPAGWWVILQSGIVIDAMPPAQFGQTYEILEEKGLTLTPFDQSAIEKVCGFGSTKSSTDLRYAVQKLASLKIGGIEVNFSPAQWDDLTRRAAKRNQTIDQYMKYTIDKYLQDLWTMIA
jgi:hypothetical protein